ncbi:carboxymuconolactone decarboxylase family protein [Cytophagaceae bacterium YF14B1]|uniref:Carboxymuconolactone decarboxylase family protein n=1 Tax=Xanthocytophaga flava TaxID=3048013 RepID=A0AAE3U7P0_9BACT|nr:carboxymuconolactone decarboxylase family protein [Xanthocytophaga flavus]MDJ1482626.1 carboxymuconolactone decarboxylase family protein [Xanthocytophaga flavus]
MEARVKIQEAQPAAWKAMYGLETYLASTQVAKTHKELIKIRASQINGCAFCIDMHTKDALKNGESAQRIFLLNAWKEADVFTDEEKVILAIAEEVTLIHQHGLTEETYQKAKDLFGESYIAQLIMVVVSINAWNRIAVSTHLAIPH